MITGAEPVMVEGDQDRLKQLFANLVENALRYTRESDQVAVRVAGDRDPMQRLPQVGRSSTGKDPMALAHVTLADTGIGIAPEDLPHVFERFYRVDRARSRAQRGSGLGLSIAQYIAQAHGGWIEAASAGLNRGSTFHVYLPLLEPARIGSVGSSSGRTRSGRVPAFSSATKSSGP
jgi:signal transduction histidine kinase